MSANASSTADFDAWLEALGERHLADLTTTEVARALRALSSCYVERRSKLASGGALDSAGKRAAFALFYGPQHFIIAREIARALFPGEDGRYARVVDLGCGTGSAGAAVALEAGARSIEGFDINRWAVAEATWTYRTLGLRGRAVVSNLRDLHLDAQAGSLIVAAYAVNELDDQARDQLLPKVLEARSWGASALIVEPIARKGNRWWPAWLKAFSSAGGQENEWRFNVRLPPRPRLLAKAAGLDVQELTARSLFL